MGVIRRVLRSRFGGNLLGWAFEHMSAVLPVRRLRETETLIAFYHPEPVYPVHILLVPKMAISEITALVEVEADYSGRFMRDLLKCTLSLVEELGLAARGYRLIVNGGAFQELPQLHFHLVSG